MQLSMLAEFHSESSTSLSGMSFIRRAYRITVRFFNSENNNIGSLERIYVSFVFVSSHMREAEDGKRILTKFYWCQLKLLRVIIIKVQHLSALIDKASNL